MFSSMQWRPPRRILRAKSSSDMDDLMFAKAVAIGIVLSTCTLARTASVWFSQLCCWDNLHCFSNNSRNSPVRISQDFSSLSSIKWFFVQGVLRLH
ncbi:unnamed protein product [Bathycoccus prasinos]